MIKKVFKDKSGSSFPLAVVFCLIFILVGSLVFEIAKVLSISKDVRNQLQSYCVSELEKNWVNIYPCLRDGYSGGFKYDKNRDCWVADIQEPGDLSKIGFVKEQNSYAKYVNGRKLYSLSNVKCRLSNSDFKPQNNRNSMRVDISARLTVKVAGNLNFETVISVYSYFLPKF